MIPIIIIACEIILILLKSRIAKMILSLFQIACIVFTSDVLLYFEVTSIFLSLPISYVLYTISLFIVGFKLNKENLLIKKTVISFSIRKKLYKEELFNIYTSLHEELIFRGVVQYTLFRVTESVFVSTIVTIPVFTIIHIRKNIPLVQLLDIFVFSIAISTLYAMTLNIYTVIIIHIARNALVIYQKYIIAQNELDRYYHIIELNKTKKQMKV